MKQLNFNLFLLKFLALLALGLITVQAEVNANEAGAVSKISYDRQTDDLSVTAEATTLKSVLGRIAQRTGIEVLFDDKADKPLSINIQSGSLEYGLKQILKGSNHMLSYSRDDKEKLLLIGVTVLPAGEQDSHQAKRLIGIEAEAYHRARAQLSHDQVAQMDKISERWQARLKEMPDELREALEKRTNERLLKKIKRDQEKAEMLEQERQMSAEDHASALATRQEAIGSLNPQQQTIFEQNSAASREQMRLLLQGNQ
ncbi:MAG: hypothetical protein OEY06_03315 [Gammaproteobacteria bacterium]|nr:hypothetical protein [Gammaproteobacteria bacterium]